MKKKKEILTNAQKRLKEMEFDLAFYKNIYYNFPIIRTQHKIELLETDVEELKQEIEIFVKENN